MSEPTVHALINEENLRQAVDSSLSAYTIVEDAVEPLRDLVKSILVSKEVLARRARIAESKLERITAYLDVDNLGGLSYVQLEVTEWVAADIQQIIEETHE